MAFVAGIGKTNVDLIFNGVPRLPGEGEEVYASDFSIALGGGIPATLLNLARLGVPVNLATALGEDLFSVFAGQAFAAAGVKPVNLYKPGLFPVNVTAAAITKNDRTFLSYGPEEVPEPWQKEQFYAMAKGAKVVLMQKGYLDVYRQLKAEGAVLVFDTGWDDAMTLDGYRPYLELADYYTPNVREALKITGAPTPEKAAQCLAGLFPRVVVKLDKDGCLGVENGETFLVPNIPAFESVDATGAGDAFLAGFVYGLFHERTFKECILYGNLTGGKCITDVGCLTAFLTEPALLQMAKTYSRLLP